MLSCVAINNFGKNENDYIALLSENQTTIKLLSSERHYRGTFFFYFRWHTENPKDPHQPKQDGGQYTCPAHDDYSTQEIPTQSLQE